MPVPQRIGARRAEGLVSWNDTARSLRALTRQLSHGLGSRWGQDPRVAHFFLHLLSFNSLVPAPCPAHNQGDHDVFTAILTPCTSMDVPTSLLAGEEYHFSAQTAVMLTPSFDLKQDDEFVILSIRVPYVKVGGTARYKQQMCSYMYK